MKLTEPSDSDGETLSQADFFFLLIKAWVSVRNLVTCVQASEFVDIQAYHGINMNIEQTRVVQPPTRLDAKGRSG